MWDDMDNGTWQQAKVVAISTAIGMVTFILLKVFVMPYILLLFN